MKRNDENLAFMLQYENVAWYDNGKVKVLDRRVYPSEVRFEVCCTYQEVSKAIKDMVTQSAGPYTLCGMGMALAAYQCKDLPKEKQLKFLEEAAFVISHSRPTTINRMTLITQGCLAEQKKALENGCSAIDAAFNRTVQSLERRYGTMQTIAEHLISLFPKTKTTVMTQCFGETIVGCMAREIKKRGLSVKFFVPETRPYLQGSRLTASVLYDMGFEVKVITDNMPAWIMENNGVDIFTSAADTICMDGSIVNKIGTLQIATIAKTYGVPYFVTGIPDADKKNRNDVVIEERDKNEVLCFRGMQVTMEGVDAFYPAFDITPPHLVSAIVTDKGVFAPYDLNRYLKQGVNVFY